MRLAIFATPTLLADMRPAPGALDGDVFRARLAQDDTGFEICDLDPAVDLAEQLDALFDRKRTGPGDEVLFYASCRVVVSAEGEFFLCLDPQHPATGDALADVTDVLLDRAAGPLLLVLECRHAANPRDPFLSASVVGAAKEAVRPQKTGVALLIAARPESSGAEERPSPFTQAMLDALDDVDEGEGLSAEAIYERISESEALVGIVPCFAHARGRGAFELLAGRATKAPAPRAKEAARSDVVDDDGWGDAATDAAPAVTEPERPAAAPEPAPAAVVPAAPESRRRSVPPTALPEGLSFKRADPVALPRVMISDRPPPPAPPPPKTGAPSAASPARASPPTGHAPPSFAGAAAELRAVVPAPPPPPAPSKPRSMPLAPRTVAEHVVSADALVLAKDHEGALSELKKALVGVGSSASKERAEIYLRIGEIKRQQGKPREAIASFEKTLQMIPTHAGAQAALLELSVADKDWRAVQIAEERLLTSLTDPESRFERLVEFGVRWSTVAKDLARARAAFEKARELRPDDLLLLGKLRDVYEATKSDQEALSTRREIARLTPSPRARAKQYYDLGQHYRLELKRDDVALELFELGLDADPSMLEPLEVVAALLAERQEWGDLEKAYRKMLNRVEHVPKGQIRSEVTWELCRRLGLLYRDHLEDPKLALDAFEDSLEEKPEDLGGHLVAADLARSIGELGKATAHLQTAAMLDPGRLATFHDLFELFQRARRPDLAFCAASVAMLLRNAESRERFIFEEHRAEGVPKFKRNLRADAWDLLRPHDRDPAVDAILDAIAPAAIAARLAQLAEGGRLPKLDPAQKQDPEKSTVSITRSFAWASHFLGIPAPAIYLREDTQVGIAAVLAEEPTVIAGAGVLRGRSLPDLAFFVGRHLGYYAGSHRLLLSFPSIEELSACFVAAVKIVRPSTPLPAAVQELASELKLAIEARLEAPARAALESAVAVFEREGSRADLGRWVSAVERTATRAGMILSGDLGVAAALLRTEPRAFLDAEEQIADLIGFSVSDEHHAIRDELGIAVEP